MVDPSGWGRAGNDIFNPFCWGRVSVISSTPLIGVEEDGPHLAPFLVVDVDIIRFWPRPGTWAPIYSVRYRNSCLGELIYATWHC